MIDEPLATAMAQRVVLRELTSADAEAFARHVAGDLERLREHLPWPDATADVDGARAWLRRYEERQDGRRTIGGAWRGDELLGGALLLSHDPANAVIELGVWMTRAGAGRGVADAACRAMLRHARAELAAERVVWRCATGNHRSRRLAERLGFVHEGTARSDHVLRGERRDTHVLSLVGAEIDAAVLRAPAPG